MSDLGFGWPPPDSVADMIRPGDVLVVPMPTFSMWQLGRAQGMQRDLLELGAPPAGSLHRLPLRVDYALPPGVLAIEQDGRILASINFEPGEGDA